MSARRATVRPGRPPWMEAIRPLSRGERMKGIPRRSRWAERQAAGLGQLCPHLRDLVQLPAQGSDLILQGLTILPHVRRAPSRCEDLKFPAGLPAGTCLYYKRRRAGPQGGRCPGRSAGKNFSSSKVGYGSMGQKTVLISTIIGPRRRAERMIPLQQKRRNMRGPALLAALSMVLTAVPAALAVETAAGTPPAVTEAPIRMCRRRRGTPPSRRT